MLFLVEIPHAHLTEVTWVVLVEVDAMVMLTAGVTSTSGMLTVLANTTMTVAHMPSELPCFTQSGWLLVLSKNYVY